MKTYKDEKIAACLQALEGLRVQGTQNMLNVLFVKQVLDNPEKPEGGTNGSH